MTAMPRVTIAGTVQTDRDGRGSMTTEWVWRFDHGATMALKSSGTMVPDAQRITRCEGTARSLRPPARWRRMPAAR